MAFYMTFRMVCSNLDTLCSCLELLFSVTIKYTVFTQIFSRSYITSFSLYMHTQTHN